MAKCINCNKNAYYRHVDNERKTPTHCGACKAPGMIHHGWCKHGRHKAQCKEDECRANATGLCKHNNRKAQCKEEECRANATAFCKHGNRKARCKEDDECRANATELCKHGNYKSICKEDDECRANATALCKHGNQKARCKEDDECSANASALCKHSNRKADCREDDECRANATSICKHGNYKTRCLLMPCCFTASSVCQICFNHLIRGSYTVGDVRSCATCFHADFNARLGECTTPAQRRALFRKPSNRRIKEIRIAGDLVEAFGDRGWDPQGYTADCDDTLVASEAKDNDSAMGGFVRLKWYFTDMESFIGNGTILVVEIDEYQHKQYPVTCEYNRMVGVVAAHRGKRVLFARFNPDEYSRNGLQVASTFTKNADGLLEPNDLYKHSMAFFVQCVRELCSGSLLCLDDSNGLAGVMYVNYSTDSPAVAYASEKLGPSNVCQLSCM